MARNFTKASSHYLEHAAAVVSSMPLTMACWGRASSYTAEAAHSLMAISRASGGVTDCYLLDVVNVSTLPGYPVLRAWSGTGTGATGIYGTTTATAGTWFHAASVFASSTSRSCYLNAAKATTTVSQTGGAFLNRTSIGRIANYKGTPINYWNGDIAEAGIWSAALTDGEVASLADGVSPLLVRPESLVAYWPLIGRDSPESDRVGGFGMTVTGATAAAHPRIYLPSSGLWIPTAEDTGEAPAVSWWAWNQFGIALDHGAREHV